MTGPICRAVIGIYIVLGAIALAMVTLNSTGMLGVSTPLAGVFAILLSLPWSLALSRMAGTMGIGVYLTFLGVGMVVNVLILGWLCGRLHRRPR